MTFKKLLYRLILFFKFCIYNVGLVNDFCFEKKVPFSKENCVLVKNRSNALTQALVFSSQWTKLGKSDRKEGTV